MTKRRLWGYEFTLVKDGLAVEDVQALLKSVGNQADTWLEQTQHLSKLQELSQRMENMAAEVQETIRGVQANSARTVEQQKNKVLEEARNTADTVIAEAEESAHAIIHQAEEAAGKVANEAEEKVKELEEQAEAVKAAAEAAIHEAENMVSAAKERAKGIELGARERAFAIEREAKGSATAVYRESKEQAEAMMGSVIKRIQQLVETESETIAQALGSLQKDEGSKETLANVDLAGAEADQLVHEVNGTEPPMNRSR